MRPGPWAITIATAPIRPRTTDRRAGRRRRIRIHEGYGAGSALNVDQLGLVAGHTYRIQFMVHDGDQNKTGGTPGRAA